MVDRWANNFSHSAPPRTPGEQNRTDFAFSSGLRDVLLLNFPRLRLRQRVVAREHLGRFLIALELPIQPPRGHNGELSAVRPAVRSAVAHIHVGGKGWNLLNS